MTNQPLFCLIEVSLHPCTISCRQEKLEQLASRFNRKSGMRETWLSENQRLVSQDNFGFDLASVEAGAKKHEAIETDIFAYEERVQVRCRQRLNLFNPQLCRTIFPYTSSEISPQLKLRNQVTKSRVALLCQAVMSIVWNIVRAVTAHLRSASIRFSKPVDGNIIVKGQTNLTTCAKLMASQLGQT